MTATTHLRATTRVDHDRVDALYGAFDLTERDSYAAFLAAHARALPAVEAALASFDGLPPHRPRTAALLADLAAMGQAMPTPLGFALDDAAAAWGALYVAEGSRLGGIMLAGQVDATFPSTYLAARHAKGEWRALLAALDVAAGGEAWLARAEAGARDTFDLYARAVTG